MGMFSRKKNRPRTTHASIVLKNERLDSYCLVSCHDNRSLFSCQAAAAAVRSKNNRGVERSYRFIVLYVRIIPQSVCQVYTTSSLNMRTVLVEY